MKQRLKKTILRYLLFLIVIIGYYFFVTITGYSIPCVFREITGYMCPGCGVTHMLFDIFNLRFKQAFYDNPLVFIMLPFIIAYFIYQSYLYVYNKKDEILVKIPLFFKISILVITILFGIIRNF